MGDTYSDPENTQRHAVARSGTLGESIPVSLVMRSDAADRGTYGADAERYIWWVSVAGALIIRERV